LVVVALVVPADALDADGVKLECATGWLEAVDPADPLVEVVVDAPVVLPLAVFDATAALAVAARIARDVAAVRCDRDCETAGEAAPECEATSLCGAGLLACVVVMPATTPPPATATAATAAATRPRPAAGEAGPASWVTACEAVCNEVKECEVDVLDASLLLP